MAGRADQTVEIWVDGAPLGAGNPLPTDASSGGGGTGGLTDAELRASPVPVSAAALTSLDTKAPALGQALAAASVPVVLTAAQITTITPSAVTTVADGADVALGTTTDASTANTVIGRLKKLLSVLPAALGSATSANSLPVVIASDQAAVAVDPSAARRGTITDRSGTITAGGTAQNAMAANAARKYLVIRNPTTSGGVIWFNFTTTAVVTGSPSIRLDPGDSFVMEAGFVSTEAISVVGTNTGQAWTAKEG